MKFHRSDIPKMGISAAVTALVFFIVFYQPRRPHPTTGERMSWNEAQALMNNYMRNPLVIESLDREGNTISTPLQGFSMDAGDIDEVINRNENGKKGNEIANKLMIYFGKRRGDDGLSNLQLIAVGIENDTLMKNADGNNNRKSSVFDRADPCPPNCPVR